MARLTDAIQRGTRAAQPAATAVSAGTLYYVTDESKTERSTGAAWQDCTDAGSAAHNLLSATHSDTTAASVVRGDILIGDATPKWVRLPKGTNGHVLTMGANDPAWSAAAAGGDSTSTAAYASRPAASNDGNLFLPSDGFYLERDTGAAWVPWGPIFPMTAVVDGDYAWINQGGASVSATNGGIFLSAPATAVHSLRIRKKAAPATPYTITLAIQMLIDPRATNQAGHCGAVFRQSSDGKLHTFSIWYSAGLVDLTSTKWNSATSFSAHYVSDTGTFASNSLFFLRIADNGTNRICSFSWDGQNFRQFDSQTRTDFMTADEIGFYASTPDATYPIGMTLFSLKAA